MDTLDKVLLVAAGVALSMAGQLATAAVFTWSARVIGEDDQEVADYVAFVLWPVPLVSLLGSWAFAFLVALAAFLLDQGPPDDGPKGGSAC